MEPPDEAWRAASKRPLCATPQCFNTAEASYRFCEAHDREHLRAENERLRTDYARGTAHLQAENAALCLEVQRFAETLSDAQAERDGLRKMVAERDGLRKLLAEAEVALVAARKETEAVRESALDDAYRLGPAELEIKDLRASLAKADARFELLAELVEHLRGPHA